MPYLTLAYFHLATVLPALFIGAVLLLARKGTAQHKRLGKIYLALMLSTAAITLFMPAAVGARLFDHFGFIHGLSLLVLCTAPRAYFAARRGNIRAHMRAMILIYGGMLVAGLFAFSRGRMLHEWVFG